ncbi:MAG TPA: 2'-5' RNA ligase family protein, partial [Candidatus Saccharimonadales bacterium]
MSFTVGIGALLDTKTSNTVRFLELTAADATKNFDGLAQPPHITVKRPFSVASLEDIEKLQALLEGLAQKTPAFNVHYSGMGSFGNSTLFLAVQSSKDLQHL